MRQEKIIEFEKKIGYTFENPYLLVTALTHSSYSNEKRLKKYKCNERLEFFGRRCIRVDLQRVYF